MYKLYIFNEEGRYHAPVYVETDELVLSIVFRYIDLVPRIMVTESDESVFETEDGRIVFPEFDPGTLAAIRARFEPLVEDVTIHALMKDYKHLTAAYEESQGRNEDIYRSMVHVENDLFALAARDNVSLSSFGWKSSGIIQAELDAV